MIRYNQFLYLLFFPVLLTACGNESEIQTDVFNYHFDFKDEIARLEKENPVVSKSIKRKGKTEFFKEKVNWKNELRFFKEANINNPRYKNSYSEHIQEETKTKTVTYTAIEEDLPVRELRYVFEGNDLSEVHILSEMNNLITKSKYELTYYPNRKYRISVNQSVPLFYEESLEIEGNINLWRGALQINSDSTSREIPFHFYFFKTGEKSIVEINNAEERIICDEVDFKTDSVFIRLPVYDSEIKAILISDTLMQGLWFNYSKGSDYSIPFIAEYGSMERFKSELPGSPFYVEGKWSAMIAAGQSDSFPAVGIFKQSGNRVTGTFLTETGDFRYLEGLAENNKLMLSGFNGSHAFLFKAEKKNDSLLEGKFYSGKHWYRKFTARKNDNAELTDPDSLTYLKPGCEKVSFAFPDLDSNIISLSDQEYINKVVIIQIMGSWCPNCLDETEYLAELYKRKNREGLEIIGLSFERSTEFAKAKKAVERFNYRLKTPYKILIAGTASVAKANEALPMLDKVMSFPTTIFLDRTGKVRKIHTGFYGPGTGIYFEQYKKETEEFLDTLLKERPQESTL